MKKSSIVLERHVPLIQLYHQDPATAFITDKAVVNGVHLVDPFRTVVHLNDELNVPMKTGIHRALGGDHDFPNPGDILCAALAACFESTIRMIADRMQIQLCATQVVAKAYVDVRGTLLVDTDVPVGFQHMDLSVRIESNQQPEDRLVGLIKWAKHCCIVFQTLSGAMPINLKVQLMN